MKPFVNYTGSRIIGSVGITVPCVYYLAQPQLNKKPHGSDHGHDSHASGDEHGDEPQEGEKSGEDKPSEGAEEPGSDDTEEKKGGEDGDKDGHKEETDSQESSDDGEKLPEHAEDTSRDEQPEEDKDEDKEQGKEEKPEKQNRDYSVTKEKSSSEGLEGVRFKGATKAGKDGRQTHTEKHIPDAKGFNKKRLESDYGTVLGAAEDDEQSADDQDLVSFAVRDSVAQY